MKLPGEMKRCPYCGSEPMSMIVLIVIERLDY